MEFTIKNSDHTFRVKEMNAIEALSLRNVIDFDNFKTTENVFRIILEHLEVKSGDVWLPVKEKDREIYYPANIENDVHAVDELTKKFFNDYFKPLFRKSDESKS